MDRRSAGTIAMLGTAQTLAWASSYYLPAILAAPMARDLRVSGSLVFLAFSAALVVSAFVGPHAGQAIDRWGGRFVLAGTNAVFALGLLALSQASGPYSLFAAWTLIGVGMGAGLYEAAFAALVWLHGDKARGSITGITLVAGFASTIGWPLSTYLEAHVGWRGACMAWAAFHLCIGLPLNLLLPRAAGAEGAGPIIEARTNETTQMGGTSARRATILLSFVFASTWFVSTAMAAHLPTLLVGAGASLAAAVAAGALVGPAQVAARVVEYLFLRRLHPLVSAKIATVLHSVGALALTAAGGGAAAAFTILHGAGNGILTIAKGTLPLVLFGPHGYGRRQGVLTVPTRIAQASAPWLFGLCLDRWGTNALWLSSALGILSLGALMLLPTTAPQGVTNELPIEAAK